MPDPKSAISDAFPLPERDGIRGLTEGGWDTGHN